MSGYKFPCLACYCIKLDLIRPKKKSKKQLPPPCWGTLLSSHEVQVVVLLQQEQAEKMERTLVVGIIPDTSDQLEDLEQWKKS